MHGDALHQSMEYKRSTAMEFLRSAQGKRRFFFLTGTLHALTVSGIRHPDPPSISRSALPLVHLLLRKSYMRSSGRHLPHKRP